MVQREYATTFDQFGSQSDRETFLGELEDRARSAVLEYMPYIPDSDDAHLTRVESSVYPLDR